MNEIIRYVIGGVTSSVGEYLSYLLALKVLKFSPYIGVIIGLLSVRLFHLDLMNSLYLRKSLEKHVIAGMH